jgi:two-component system CheB/CheR fusion protein
MAFVLVPHLDPSHHSLLTEILQRSTAMPVAEALDQLAVEANHVYIIPPNREMSLQGGLLQISLPEQARGLRMPIDAFLRSLADDQGDRAIGIILSGTATDGTLGLRAILGAGGVCMVQEPASAKYDGMPQSAINAGYATHILPVEQMPAMLLSLTRTPGFHLIRPSITPARTRSGIKQILQQVRSVTGHDFSLYKKSTIGRRIERRMAQHNIDETAVYARYLKENPAEVALLFKELLINVTSFFRDPEAFATLQQTILPALLADKPTGYVFRVWVAGCASGEEAYSIAIVLHELLDDLRNHHNPNNPHAQDISLQIYATDLDDDAIATARIGRYPPNIASDVTPERLRRFFSKDDGAYKVKKEIREMIVFAVQNVIKDPPFTRLDLLSCRNLMIYLEPELQNRLIPTFHYALKPDGVLLLSSSESIANHPELFSALDRKWKFYRARHASVTRPRQMPHSPLRFDGTASHTEDASMIDKPKAINIVELSNRALLQAYAPASVSTDADGNILYVHGDTGRYLRPAPGLISTNIVEMAREGLSLELRSALLNATTATTPPLNREVSVKTNGGFSRVNLSVRRLPNPQADASAGEPLLLVSFQEVAGPGLPAAGSGRRKRSTTPAEAGHAELLERELAFAKESLQATIEEQQATNEELKSTNEELQSTNEELQSANEELETSKEELQSLNEEMVTVNAEQNARIEQLSDLQNDMKNLLDSTNVGTLFLDHQLCIRRFTREAAKAYCLVATDVGRPLSDIKSNLAGDDLLADLQSVLDTLVPREREVCSNSGAHYLARMQPYRTLDNVIEGAVLTFTDITESGEAARLRFAAQQLACELAEGIIDMVSQPLIVLDAGLQVVSASAAFYAQFQVAAEQTVGRRIYDLGNGQWNIPALRQLLEAVLPQNQVINDYLVDHDFPGLGARRMRLNARRIVTGVGNTELILLAIPEINEKGGA